ncbi:MAG TPA: LysM peptidoglycan-binding domain-containing protein [Puia sp.]|nr:LysM peptidoglycan-binding domain-containing protein [Puia sp.]
MPEKYKVSENETLAQIANKKGFNTNTLIKANPDIFSLVSPEALAPDMGLLIPVKTNKKVPQLSGTKATYVLIKSPKQFLTINLEDANNEIQSAELFINGSSVAIKSVEESRQPPYFTISTINPIPDDDISSSSIKLKMLSAITGKESEQEIKVEIGGLDPIIDPFVDPDNPHRETKNRRPKKAVQKILTNLGYYDGDIDGDLDKVESMIAISGFQNDFMPPERYENSYGIANFDTCVYLKMKQGNNLGFIQPLQNGL